jgi:hypothetical protein
MNSVPTQSEEPRPEMDELLSDYFQAELPKPWPQFTAPKQARTKPPETLWSRYSGRMALAACVALLVAGYLTLGDYTPTITAPGVVPVGRTIGLGGDLPNGNKPKTPPKTQDPQDRMEPMGNELTQRR